MTRSSCSNDRRGSFYQKHERLILGGTAVLVALGLWEALWEAAGSRRCSSPDRRRSSSASSRNGRQGRLKQDMAYSGTNFVIGVGLAIVVGRRARRGHRMVPAAGDGLRAVPDRALLDAARRAGAADPDLVRHRDVVEGVHRVHQRLLSGADQHDRRRAEPSMPTCSARRARSAPRTGRSSRPSSFPDRCRSSSPACVRRVALGLIGVVVGEMFGGSEGIGYMVNYGGQTFQTDTVFLGV